MKRFLKYLLVAALPVATATAGPGLINYQGRLTNSAGTPITVATNVTFTLWNANSGGTQVGGGFTDTDLITPDDRGLYSTEIGDEGGAIVPASVFDNDTVWLNVNVGGEDLAPRLRITSAGYAADADTLQGKNATAFLNMAADAYVVVQTTASATQNGTNLLAAYTAAKALTPGGAARTTTNRAVVVVPPGRYDLGGASLAMNGEFVDVVGLTSDRDSQHVLSSVDLLVQTATDVRIENLTLHYTGTDTFTYAYKPYLGSPSATTIRNCSFQATHRAMLTGVTYAGTYENCVASGQYAFGGNGSMANGTFTNCVASGSHSFGSNGGLASGTFTNCTGGLNSFGGSGTANGTFTNCTGGELSFGGAGIASGTFTNCTGGDSSFGGGGTASGGRFYHCVGGASAFTESGATAPIQFFCIQNGAQYSGNN